MKTLTQRRQETVHLTKRAGRLLKAFIKFVQQRWAESDRDKPSTTFTHAYEIRPRADKHGVDLISDALTYSPLWYRGPNAIKDAIDYAKCRSRSHRAVIRVYDSAGNVIETHEHAGDFKEASQLAADLADVLHGTLRMLGYGHGVHCKLVNCRFHFQERGQDVIRAHNETSTVIAVRVGNPHRSPVGINR